MIIRLSAVMIWLVGLVMVFPLAGTTESGVDLLFPSVVSQMKNITFCGERVPIEREEVRERFEKEFMLILWNRPQVYLWLKRSTRYFPYIEKEMKAKGLPEDLKFLAVTESALLPHIGSSKGALGVWQLIETTGKKYGLTVNSHIDERRNYRKSTRAALDYLEILKKQFGSWSLAIAAYNMGEEGLLAEIMEQESKDYYDLYLPLETQQFLFRMIVTKMVMQSPEKFGFHLTKSDYYQEHLVETVEIECFQPVPVAILARAASTTFKKIKDLNPELRGYFLMSGKHTIALPVGARKGFLKRFETLSKVYEKKRKNHTYVVKKGEHLSGIAEKFSVPLKSIYIWNQIRPPHSIKPGDQLVIYSIDMKGF